MALGRAQEDQIITVAVSGAGMVSLWKRNVKKCKCARCGKSLEPERGYQFRKFRYSDEEYPRGGYVCGECVGKALEGTERWFWNGAFFSLQKTDYEFQSLNGPTLATVWHDHGVSGLAFVLDESRA